MHFEPVTIALHHQSNLSSESPEECRGVHHDLGLESVNTFRGTYQFYFEGPLKSLSRSNASMNINSSTMTSLIILNYVFLLMIILNPLNNPICDSPFQNDSLAYPNNKESIECQYFMDVPKIPFSSSVS